MPTTTSPRGERRPSPRRPLRRRRRRRRPHLTALLCRRRSSLRCEPSHGRRRRPMARRRSRCRLVHRVPTPAWASTSAPSPSWASGPTYAPAAVGNDCAGRKARGGVNDRRQRYAGSTHPLDLAPTLSPEPTRRRPLRRAGCTSPVPSASSARTRRWRFLSEVIDEPHRIRRVALEQVAGRAWTRRSQVRAGHPHSWTRIANAARRPRHDAVVTTAVAIADAE